MRCMMVPNVAESTKPLVVSSESALAVRAGEVSNFDALGKSGPAEKNPASQDTLGPLVSPFPMDAREASTRLRPVSFEAIPEELKGLALSYVEHDDDVRNVRLVDRKTKILADHYNAKARQKWLRATVQLCVLDPEQAVFHLQNDGMARLLAKGQRLDLTDMPLFNLKLRPVLVKLAGLMQGARDLVVGHAFQGLGREASLETLRKIMVAMPKVEKVSLQRDIGKLDGGTGDGYIGLLKALRDVGSLKDLQLGVGHLPDRELVSFCEMLKEKPRMFRLALLGSAFTVESSRALELALREMRNLTDLELDSLHVQDGARDAFLAAIRPTEDLVKVLFDAVCWPGAGVSVLQALAGNKNLKSLGYTMSVADAAQMDQARDVISSWKNLIEISLRFRGNINSVALERMISLASAASGLTKLTLVFQSGPYRSFNIASAPFLQLANCHSLKELHLDVDELNERSFAQLLVAIQKLPKLEMLDLSRVRAVCNSIDKHKKLSIYMAKARSIQVVMHPRPVRTS